MRWLPRLESGFSVVIIKNQPTGIFYLEILFIILPLSEISLLAEKTAELRLPIFTWASKNITKDIRWIT